ncbi:hypothetical protein IV203_008701 [Nitzschia inconspicua]|uniref:Uncharacterized protein n=1 Tax=Nitzschia inconspicua TaxID=303405 RepID=A0A9K3L0K1_9STRA|nr:hypothetical protein IV203_008701 [Nitzschia inconspicua]
MNKSNYSVFDDVVAEKMKETSRSSKGDGDVQDVEDHRSTPGSIPSSSTPIASSFVLEVAPRNGRWGSSKDPLFRGVCLYDGAMTREQVEKYYNHNTILATTSSSRNNHDMEHRSSWTPLSIFRLFF